MDGGAAAAGGGGDGNPPVAAAEGGDGNPPAAAAVDNRTLGMRDDQIEQFMDWIVAEHSKSVVRIIIHKDRNRREREAEDSSTAFLVRMLPTGTGVFLTCDHCIKEEAIERAFIRVSGGTTDLKVKVLYRDKTRDCLMFQVKDIEQKYGDLLAVHFSSAEIDLHSCVAILGYSCPSLFLQRGNMRRCEIVLVEEPSPFPGTVTGQYEDEHAARFKVKLRYDTPATAGVSGSPVLRHDGLVIGIHTGAVGLVREGITVQTLNRIFRDWLARSQPDEQLQDDVTMDQLITMLGGTPYDTKCISIGRCEHEVDHPFAYDSDTEKEDHEPDVPDMSNKEDDTNYEPGEELYTEEGSEETGSSDSDQEEYE